MRPETLIMQCRPPPALKVEDGKSSFVPHWIETDFPTFHTMALADLEATASRN